MLNIKTITAIKIILLIAIIPFLFIAETLVGHAVYVSIAVIVWAVLQLSSTKYTQNRMHLKKSEWILVVFLSFLFILMMSIFDILQSGFLDIDKIMNEYSAKTANAIWIWGHFIYLPGVIISSGIVIINTIQSVLRNSSTRGGGSEIPIIGVF